jgi:hypothetical protein
MSKKYTRYQEAISNHPDQFVSLVTLKYCSKLGPEHFNFVILCCVQYTNIYRLIFVEHHLINLYSHNLLF